MIGHFGNYMDLNHTHWDRKAVFPVKFQLSGFVPLTTEKWGYKEKNRGTKQN